MKYRKASLIKLKDYTYTTFDYLILEVYIAEEGVYIRSCYDINPSYGARKSELHFHPMSELVKIEF